ncbi:hypothetical protein LTR53_007539 [Teratosphaeriaceae sp. CCFEE 6253]|nr:hypothetical protein LTR53_007539 [Teratosphaeriaceae sp. CCFEE 6253]
MPFGQHFEKRVNTGMQEDIDHSGDAGVSKTGCPRTPEFTAEVADADMSEKKDRPPRFSTLFGAAPPTPTRNFESYPSPARKSGIWLPTSLFVLFAVVLLFESTLLFAYTVIGLYHNLPAGLISTMPQGCNCEARQPTVNIAPNIVMPQAQAAVTHTITVSGEGVLSNVLPTILASSTNTIDTSSQAAAIASNVLGMLSIATASSSHSTSAVASVTGATTSTLILSVVPPPRSTVNSVKLVTVNPAGSTLPPRPTVTQTTVVDASQAVPNKSFQAAVSGLAAALTTSAPSSSENPSTSTTSTSAPGSTGPAPTTSLSTSSL